jgi:hypothetical protein
MGLVCKIIITTNTLYLKRRKQNKQIIQILMLPSAKTVCQNYLGVVVNGPPKPTLMRFIMDKKPHFTLSLPLQSQYDQPKQHQFLNFNESEDKPDLFSKASFVFF